MAISPPEQAMNATLSIADTDNSPRLCESIGARFSDVASRFPGRIVLSSGSISWTYSELEDDSNAIASTVLELSNEGTKTVALLLKHDAPLVAAILGVLKAGKIYVSLGCNYTACATY